MVCQTADTEILTLMSMMHTEKMAIVRANMRTTMPEITDIPMTRRRYMMHTMHMTPMTNMKKKNEK